MWKLGYSMENFIEEGEDWLVSLNIKCVQLWLFCYCWRLSSGDRLINLRDIYHCVKYLDLMLPYCLSLKNKSWYWPTFGLISHELFSLLVTNYAGVLLKRRWHAQKIMIIPTKKSSPPQTNVFPPKTPPPTSITNLTVSWTTRHDTNVIANVPNCSRSFIFVSYNSLPSCHWWSILQNL